ncbi:MAG: metallophosphoesterase [Microthrixaceae bacterium]
MSTSLRSSSQVGAAERLLRAGSRPGAVDLFAIEPDRIQIVWPEGCRSPIRAHIDGRTVDLDSASIPSGAGSAVIADLSPGTPYELTFTCRSAAGSATTKRRFRTPESPLGAELFRFATMSDLHLGRGALEYRGPVAHLSHNSSEEDVATRESSSADVQLRIARSAVSEALEWGAQHLVLKGDVCDQGYDWIWDQAASLLGDLPIPVSIIPGNHDTGQLRKLEPEFAAKDRGLHVTRSPEAVELPGMSLILVDSTVPGTSWGSLDRSADEVADLASHARRSGRGVAVMSHHHPQRFAVPLFWPHGVPGPDAGRFVSSLGKADPAAFVSSGHTHRCRRRKVGGVAWSEVAATSQFPGVWAGYVVHEGGLRQTVHRIADPASLELIEPGRALLSGIWALWSTGNLSDRCFNVGWTR